MPTRRIIAITLSIFFGFSMTHGRLAQAEEALKNTNLTISPIGFLLGSANLSADFGITDNIAIGPNIAYSGASFGTTSGYSLGFGADATFFLGHKRFTDGLFLAPSVAYSILNMGSFSASGIRFGADVGYGWFWPSGFNLSVGAGMVYSTASIAGFPISGVIPSILFQLGYAF